jgi:hypothetical protein
MFTEYRNKRNVSFMTITIEKNVPIPQRTRLPELPFGDMEVGDSFLVPLQMQDSQSVASLRQRVSRYQRANDPKRFSTVKSEGGMRVFRIA